MSHPSVQNLRESWSSIDGVIDVLAVESCATRSL